MEKTKRAKTYMSNSSDKHDILYSKARYVLNQRHIKRPWFNLNPFLEKTDETIDLENYLPDESRYILPLESLVLCESYHSSHPLDTRELGVGSFFEYLYSDNWSAGCSIRVLEGQLLDQLLLCLYRLEKEKYSIRHTTYAFARNRRNRKGCYKLANQHAFGIDHFTVTSWLPDILLSVMGKQRTRTPPGESWFSALPLLDPAASINAEGSFFRPTNLPNSGVDAQGQGQDRRRTSISSKPINVTRFLQTISQNPKPRSISVFESTTSGTPMSVLQGYNFGRGRLNEPIPEVTKQRIQDIRSNGLATSQLLKKFPLHKYNKQANGKSTSDNNEETSDKSDEDDLLGEEFYLCDARVEAPSRPEPVKSILQRKKVELQQRRQARREILEQSKLPAKPLIPPLPPLTVDEQSKHETLHNTINMPDEVPTFEEFILLLKKDEFYDPRYRNKVRLKSKKIAQRYYIAKGQRRNSYMFGMKSIPGTLLDHLSHIGGGGRRKSNPSDYGSRVTLQLPFVKVKERTTVKAFQPATNTSSPDPIGNSIADEVWGVTDSEACREYCLEMGKQRDEKHDRRATLPDITGARRSSISVARPMIKPDRSELPPIPSASPGPGQSNSPVPPIFPKIVFCESDEIEDQDSDTEESDTDEGGVPSEFDATKLNIRYSVERLRKKKRKNKKKPVFFDILAKYYKMQNIMSAFRRNPMTREIKNAKTRAKHLSLAGYLRGGILRTPDEGFVLGKMRKFDFLDTEKKRPLSFDLLPTADFSVPDLQVFMDRLRGSLDDFVVRREIVVTDLQVYYKSATSVTFTKKSCFQNKHTKCDN